MGPSFSQPKVRLKISAPQSEVASKLSADAALSIEQHMRKLREMLLHLHGSSGRLMRLVFVGASLSDVEQKFIYPLLTNDGPLHRGGQSTVSSIARRPP